MTTETSTQAGLPAAQTTRRAQPSRIARILLGLGAAGLVVAGAVGSASAASPTPSTRPAAESVHRFCSAEWLALAANRTVETLRAVGNCEIDRRIFTLDQLDARVAAAPQFTDLHKEQLRKVNNVNPASYEAEKAGLRELRAKINAETDLQKLRGLIADIAEDFRVYVLVVPKTHLVGGADAADKAVDRLTQLATRLQELIDKAKGNGKDVRNAQALLDDMKSKTSRADGLVSPVVGTIMPLSPADWNNGTAGPALGAARNTLHQVRELLAAARSDAKQIIDLLKT